MTPNAILSYEGTINAQRLNKYLMCNRKIAQSEYKGAPTNEGKEFRSISSYRREILENEDQIIASALNINYRKLVKQAGIAITVTIAAVVRNIGF